jgi:hypothetical protein
MSRKPKPIPLMRNYLFTMIISRAIFGAIKKTAARITHKPAGEEEATIRIRIPKVVII